MVSLVTTLHVPSFPQRGSEDPPHTCCTVLCRTPAGTPCSLRCPSGLLACDYGWSSPVPSIVLVFLCLSSLHPVSLYLLGFQPLLLEMGVPHCPWRKNFLPTPHMWLPNQPSSSHMVTLLTSLQSGVCQVHLLFPLMPRSSFLP